MLHEGFARAQAGYQLGAGRTGTIAGAPGEDGASAAAMAAPHDRSTHMHTASSPRAAARAAGRYGAMADVARSVRGRGVSRFADGAASTSPPWEAPLV